MAINLKNHIALDSAAEIRQICKPLEKLGITYFSFVRSFADNSHIRLSNNPAWTEHYYTRSFYNVIINQVPDAEGNLLWSNIDKYPLFYEASEFFNVDNGTVIVLKMEDVTERYFFGSVKGNHAVNYIYVHHLDLLKKFILYFKETAASIIQAALRSRIYLPTIVKSGDPYSETVIQEFLDEIKVEKVYVRVHGRDIYITPNEAKILALMKNGLTAKEIANEINLKQKTIEAYRDKLKTKLELFSKSNLLTVANENSLLDLKIIK